MAEQPQNKNLELKYNIYQPFGPSVLKVKMPQQFVYLLNTEADRILGDEKLSKEHDWSHNLAGNVKKEVLKEIKEEEDKKIREEMEKSYGGTD